MLLLLPLGHISNSGNLQLGVVRRQSAPVAAAHYPGLAQDGEWLWIGITDPLTKSIPRAKHDQHQNSMGVRFITM